jgi:hypothetical protein
LENLCVDGRAILKLILNEEVVRMWIGFILLGRGPSGRPFTPVNIQALRKAGNFTAIEANVSLSRSPVLDIH